MRLACDVLRGLHVRSKIDHMLCASLRAWWEGCGGIYKCTCNCAWFVKCVVAVRVRLHCCQFTRSQYQDNWYMICCLIAVSAYVYTSSMTFSTRHFRNICALNDRVRDPLMSALHIGLRVHRQSRSQLVCFRRKKGRASWRSCAYRFLLCQLYCIDNAKWTDANLLHSVCTQWAILGRLKHITRFRCMTFQPPTPRFRKITHTHSQPNRNTKKSHHRGSWDHERTVKLQVCAPAPKNRFRNEYVCFDFVAICSLG